VISAVQVSPVVAEAQGGHPDARQGHADVRPLASLIQFCDWPNAIRRIGELTDQRDQSRQEVVRLEAANLRMLSVVAKYKAALRAMKGVAIG
jgi:hypothetical protein